MISCPNCGGKAKAYSGSVSNPEKHEVYRYRICTECKLTFYTIETIAPYDGELRECWRAKKIISERRYEERRKQND